MLPDSSGYLFIKALQECRVVGTQNNHLKKKKKMMLVCEGIFQNWPLGIVLWDKTFNFEDNITLLVLKNKQFKKKNTLFVKEFIKSDCLEQSYGTKCLILKIA